MWPFSDKTWDAIKNVGILVGILGVISIIANVVRIYEFLAPSEPRLEAHCSYFMYDIPPDLHDIMVDLHNSRSGKYTSSIQNIFTGYINKVMKIINEKDKHEETSELDKIRKDLDKLRLENETINLINSIFYSIILKSFDKSLNPYNGIIYFQIENTGDKVAEDVVISLPFEGIAYVAPEGKDLRAVEVKRDVKVGNIRQKEIARVYVWSTEQPSLKHEESIRLSHKSGVGKISFFVSEHGLHFKILRDYYHLVKLVFGLWLLGSFIAGLFLSDHILGTSFLTNPVRTTQDNTTQDSTTQDSE
jgi:hypothetical protein